MTSPSFDKYLIPLTLTSTQKECLLATLAPERHTYNPETRMIRIPFQSPGYHTTLTGGDVHPTRESLIHAVALLDTGLDEDLKIAESIISAVLELQDTDTSHKTYGIWSWFREEPLEKMSPPDWNWADFCGAQLLEARLTHSHRLSPGLITRMDEGILHAARAIKIRNVGPDYTNIAVMGAFVVLFAAEIHNLDELREYGRQRIQRFYDFTLHHGAFTEFNSPTYTVVTLNELHRLQLYVKDAEILRMVNHLYHLAWEEIAVHFHSPTGQWSGPHSRCYETILSANTRNFLANAAGVKNFTPTNPARDAHRLNHRCPGDLHHFFHDIPVDGEVQKTFVKGEPDIIGITYMNPSLSLGSINYIDGFNQRRPLVAYWGTAEKPHYLRYRFLHDNYDFVAAQFFGAQSRGDILAGISFATDGGIKHPYFDRMTDGTFPAEDVRLRFEVKCDDIVFPKIDDPFTPLQFQLGGVAFAFQLLDVKFFGQKVRVECTQKDGLANIDIVLYSGTKRDFHLAEETDVSLAFAVRFGPGKIENPTAAFSKAEDVTKLSWQNLHLAFPHTPAQTENLKKAFAVLGS